MTVIWTEKDFFKKAKTEIGDLDHIYRTIYEAMGENPGTCSEDPKSPEFEQFLQDDTYRWIVASLLANALLMGTISEDRFDNLMTMAATMDGREAIAASVLLSATQNVEQLQIIGGIGIS